MLNLTRKLDEKVYLILPDGTEIEIMVTKIKGSSIQLGITAPDDVEIVRD